MKSVAPCLMLVLIPFVFDVPLQSAFESPVAPPTLTGERFTGTISNVSGTCAGVGDTMSFDSSGVATGPYAGSYSAHVTVSSGRLTSIREFQFPLETGGFAAVFAAVTEVTNVIETFEIRNAAGELLVNGTKSQVIGGDFLCADVFSESGFAGVKPGVFRAAFAPSLSYEASIFTPSGTYYDWGPSVLNSWAIALFGNVTAVSDNGFIEIFTSSLSMPTRGVPAGSNDCKDDGWMDRIRGDFTPFKSQGDCIQYVETGK